MSSDFLSRCNSCNRPIERKYAFIYGKCFSCYRYDKQARPIQDKPLPEPAMRRRPANHRGKRGQFTTTLN